MKPQYVSPSATNSGCLAQTVRTVQGYNDISPEYSPDFNDLWLMNFMSQRWHLCTKCHGFFCHKFIQSAFEPISSFSNYSVLQHSLSITLFGEIPTFFFFFFSYISKLVEMRVLKWVVSNFSSNLIFIPYAKNATALLLK